MNEVIIKPEPEYHYCIPPVKIQYGWIKTEHPEGSYWRCTCGAWFKSVAYIGFIRNVSNRWRKVRWYHFQDRRDIAKREPS
jgi:hypothetical protein